MSLPKRDVLTFPKQDRFGKSDNPAGQRGNCVATCLAALLDVPLSEVPHFYDTDEAPEVQHVKADQWLAARGWLRLWITWDWLESGWITPPPNGLVIVSGKSPRGDWFHVCIGKIVDKGWTLVHDPHPSGDGLDGTPNGFYVLAPLPILSSESA